MHRTPQFCADRARRHAGAHGGPGGGGASSRARGRPRGGARCLLSRPTSPPRSSSFRRRMAASCRDPVLDGLVPSLAHPGGNLTGFYVFAPSLAAKLLELLKEIAPHVSRVAILSNPDANPASWFDSAVAAAPRFAVEVVVAPLRDSNEIEAAMAQCACRRGCGPAACPRRACAHSCLRSYADAAG
jgi:hypothetical protein